MAGFPHCGPSLHMHAAKSRSVTMWGAGWGWGGQVPNIRTCWEPPVSLHWPGKMAPHLRTPLPCPLATRLFTLGGCRAFSGTGVRWNHKQRNAFLTLSLSQDLECQH